MEIALILAGAIPGAFAVLFFRQRLAAIVGDNGDREAVVRFYAFLGAVLGFLVAGVLMPANAAQLPFTSYLLWMTPLVSLIVTPLACTALFLLAKGICIAGEALLNGIAIQEPKKPEERRPMSHERDPNGAW